MGLYTKYVLPRLIHLACGVGSIARQRGQLVPRARGRVLEIGIGSGRNLPFYDPARVSEVYGLDPSPDLIEMARDAAGEVPFPVAFVRADAERIPLPDGHVDTVVVTYTLCSIPDVAGALREMRRVLRADGTLLFSEHGASADAGVRRWQDRINPVWRPVAGGCNLNRDIPALLRESGFNVEEVETMYLPGPRVVGFNYRGAASASAAESPVRRGLLEEDGNHR